MPSAIRPTRLVPVTLCLTLLLGVLPALASYEQAPIRTWGVDGTVHAIHQVGDRVLLGGAFSNAISPDGQSVPASNLVALDASTGELDTSWSAATDGTVFALASIGSRVYVGGAFKDVNGTRRLRMAALDAATGAVDTGWRADASFNVRALAASSDRLFAAGQFTGIGTESAERLAALSPDTGELVSGWSASADATVRDAELTPDGTTLVVGGDFANVSGEARDFLAAVDVATGALRPWRPGPACTHSTNPCIVHDLEVTSAQVFTGVAGPGGQLVAYDADSYDQAAPAEQWNIRADGDVQAVDVREGVVYAGGHFWSRFGNDDNGDPIVRRRLGAADATTGEVLDYAPTISSDDTSDLVGLWEIVADASALRIGGFFDDVSGTDQRSYAQLPPDGTPIPNEGPTAGFSEACTTLTCEFDGRDSNDPDGTINAYDWDFGDGGTAEGSVVQHTFGASGTYSVTLTVTDDDGAQDAVSREVTVDDGGSDGGTDGGSTDGSTTDGSTDGSTDGTTDGTTTDGSTDGSTDGTTTDGSTDGSTDGTTGGTTTDGTTTDGSTDGSTDGTTDGTTTDGSTDGSTDTAAAGPNPSHPVSRFGGESRIETAALLSQAHAAPGVDTVFVATATDFPDGLAVGPVAALQKAPVLLTWPAELPDVTRAEIERLSPRQIVVLGGPAAVSDTVLDALAPLAADGAARLAGSDRYGTAAAISSAWFATGADTVFVATGAEFADALSGGALAAADGAPILLVTTGAVPGVTAEELRRLAPNRIVVLGGTSAVSDEVLAELDTFASTGVQRLSGPDRYATSAAILAEFGDSVGTAFVATGQTFADSLAGTAVAGALGAPLVLVAADAVPQAVADQLEQSDPPRYTILGGLAAVGDAVEQELESRAGG